MDKPTDTPLATLLKGDTIDLSVDEVRDIIKGVAASPGTDDGAIGAPDSWLTLIGENLSRKLINTLSLELAKEVAGDNGLAAARTKNLPFSDRLAQLRSTLKSDGIDGFIIPLADEHQGEYVPKNAQRLAWLTGFTGSAGLAIVLHSSAAIFIDGRYTLQVREQVDGELFTYNHLSEQPPSDWIAQNLKSGETLGFDPWLHTTDGVAILKKSCAKAGGTLTPLGSNPIDAVWHNQPHPPLTPVQVLDETLTGVSSRNKRDEIAQALTIESLSASVLTAPDSIAWLANIRGGDVPFTPFCLSFAIQHASGDLAIYGDLRKFPLNKSEQLEDGISIHPRSAFLPALEKLGTDKSKVGVDQSTAAHIITETLKKAGAIVQRMADPCQLPKAKKNTVELNGMRQAHLRDGVALTRFLAWLDENSKDKNLSEMSVADQLESFRREGDRIQGLSFPTISGSGPNGAIVHYRVTAESDRKLDQNSLYLVDSGAQYLDGTTDVTRTIAIGTPSAEMKDRFTRVLKAHISLASAVFPAGTSGSQLDILAREPLWQAGLDYDHGTGHGVGSYLGVHEGPHRISKIPNRVALEPGMVVSNEPGYYKTDHYGIRIENLVAVTDNAQSGDQERSLLHFETLTLAPIDRNLIDLELLEQKELDWLNGYHQTVKQALDPLLDTKTKKWLKQATALLS